MIQNNIKRLLFILLTVLLLSCQADGHELSGGYTKLLSLHASENISASAQRR